MYMMLAVYFTLCASKIYVSPNLKLYFHCAFPPDIFLPSSPPLLLVSMYINVCVCAVLLVVFMAVRAGGTRGKHITYNRKATLSKRSIEMKENRTWHQHHHKYSHGKRPSDRENEKKLYLFFLYKIEKTLHLLSIDSVHAVYDCVFPSSKHRTDADWRSEYWYRCITYYRGPF